MQAEELLREVSAISKKYDLLYQKTGGYFNVFNVVNISTDEIKICQILRELLSPNGSHYQGNIYLKLFIQNVLRMEMSDLELSGAKVSNEYVIDQNRRIDLVIETQEHFIPIEVKIFAGDQEGQCYDYYQFAKEHSKRSSNLFYLTRYGNWPSEYSAKKKGGTEGLTLIEDGEYEEVTPISFERDILDWLSICIAQKETIKLAPIREVLQQFAATIRRFTNQMEEDEEMEMTNLLMESSENIRSALAIEKSLQETKIVIIEKLFKAIEDGLSKSNMLRNFERINNEFDYSKTKSYPGISYRLLKNILQNARPNVDIWLRIELNTQRFYIGFCLAENGKYIKRQEFTEKETKIIETSLSGKYKPHSEWPYLEFIPASPDLKNFDDAYCNLFDESKFEAFVEKCVKKFEELSLIGCNNP